MCRALGAVLRCIAIVATFIAAVTGTAQATPSPVTVSFTVNPPVTATTGGSISWTITISNSGPTPVALSGVNLSLPFPAGMSPYPVYDEPFTNCGTGTASDAGSALTLTNGSLAAGAQCTLSVNLITSTAGTATFNFPASALTSDQGVTNATGMMQTIDVQSKIVLTNAFTPALIVPSQTSTYSITIANTDLGSNDIGFLGYFHNIPPGLTFASPANLTSTCGPAQTIVTTEVHLAGSLLAGATCTVSVSVHGALGSYTDTFFAGGVSSTGGNTTANSNASLTIANPSALTVTPAFTAPSIVAGGTSTFTIAIANTGATPFPLTTLVLSNNLPAGVTIAPLPNAVTTCGGTASAVPGGTTLTLGSGATLGAAATCSVSVAVTAPAAGNFTDTVAASAITDDQTATNTAAAGATLMVVAPSPVVVTPVFTPATIIAGTTATLSVTIVNAGVNATALSALALSDALPAGVTIAAAPGLANTCGGTAGATAGSTALTLSGATLGAGASCSFSALVSATSAGSFTDTLAAATVTSAQGVTNAALASAVLTVTTPSPVTVSKIFAPSTILATGTAVLTVTIGNTGGNALALSALALTDALPAGVTFAALPGAVTTCPGGTATASGSTLTLNGGATLAAGATCTLSATVTSAVAASYTDATLAGAIVSNQGVTNAAAAAATLSVNMPAALTVTPAFAPASIIAGQTSTLTIGIANAGANAIALSAVGIAQTLPSGVRIAAAPVAATTCATGSVTATPATAAFALSGATLAPGASCTLAVNVLGPATGTFVMQTAAGALTTAQGVTNPFAATATLIVSAAPPVALTSAFVPAVVALGQTSTLTITLANTAAGAIPLSNLALTVALPSGTAIAANGGGATTCGGTLSAAVSATTVTLAGATVAPNATCTLTATIVPAANGVITLAIPANTVMTAQSATNTTPAQATLTVASPALTVTSGANVSGSAVSAGEPIVYTIAVTNAGTSPETNATLTNALANATLVPGSVTVNGSAAPDTVVTSGATFGTIAAGGRATIVYTATVNATIAAGASVTNRAVAGGDQPCTAASCSATAALFSAQPPVLAATLDVDGKTSESVVVGQVVVFSAAIANPGTTPAEGVSVSAALPAGVTPISGSVTTPAQTTRRTLGTVVIGGQTVSAPIGELLPGTAASIAFTARITAAPALGGIVAVTTGALGLPAAVASNTVTLNVATATLVVTKTASSAVVRAGDRIDYRIGISSAYGVDFGATSIVDRLPAGMSYAPGTARVNGVNLEPAIAGLTLTWNVATAGTAIDLTYSTAIGATSATGALVNTVHAAGTVAGGVAATGIGSASVLVVASAFGSCYPITGRVYADVRRSGHFASGDRGLAGVRIDLDDGEAVITDAQGRYNFPCVRQGMHALRLDERSLPADTSPFGDRAIDSERSTHRLVHHTFDDTIVEDINFAIDVTK